jgi:hypothetical protein
VEKMVPGQWHLSWYPGQGVVVLAVAENIRLLFKTSHFLYRVKVSIKDREQSTTMYSIVAVESVKKDQTNTINPGYEARVTRFVYISYTTIR